MLDFKTHSKPCTVALRNARNYKKLERRVLFNPSFARLFDLFPPTYIASYHTWAIDSKSRNTPLFKHRVRKIEEVVFKLDIPHPITEDYQLTMYILVSRLFLYRVYLERALQNGIKIVSYKE